MLGPTTFFLAAMIGFHLNGTYGMCVGGALGWTLTFIVASRLQGPVNKKLATYEDMAVKGLDALRTVCKQLGEGDEWQDIKRLLRHNPDINPANLELGREAVLWRYALERQLPTSDTDMADTYGRLLKARAFGTGERAVSQQVGM